MSNYYYHFSTEENTESIIKNGLKCSGGVVFLTSSLIGALTFAKFYVRPEGNEEINVFVYKIHGDMLDQSKIEVSTDHNRQYLPVDAYVYYDDIPKKAFKVEEVYGFNNKPKVEILYTTASGEEYPRKVSVELLNAFLESENIERKKVYTPNDIENFNDFLDSYGGFSYDFYGVTDI